MQCGGLTERAVRRAVSCGAIQLFTIWWLCVIRCSVSTHRENSLCVRCSCVLVWHAVLLACAHVRCLHLEIAPLFTHDKRRERKTYCGVRVVLLLYKTRSLGYLSLGLDISLVR